MKKILAFFLTVTMLLALLPVSMHAAGADAAKAADTLYGLGLFNGTGTDKDGRPIFALDRAPTRQEAVVLLVRLLGKETEALSESWNMPFTDVDSWAQPYVGYAYANGLANGTGAITFGAQNLVTASQYLTFVLRALGYDSAKDFAWDRAWELSDKIGLTSGAYNARTNAAFLRGDAAIISEAALRTKLKGTATALFTRLMDDGVILGVVQKLAETRLGIGNPKSVTITADRYAKLTIDDLRAYFPNITDLDWAFYYESETDNPLTYFMSEGNLLKSITVGQHMERISADVVSAALLKSEETIDMFYDFAYIIYDGLGHVCAVSSSPMMQNENGTVSLRFTFIDYDFMAYAAELLAAFWNECNNAVEYLDALRVLSVAEANEKGLKAEFSGQRYFQPVPENLPPDAAYICAHVYNMAYSLASLYGEVFSRAYVKDTPRVTRIDEYTSGHSKENPKPFAILDKDYKIIGYTYVIIDK